jgi:hypothetical protein
MTEFFVVRFHCFVKFQKEIIIETIAANEVHYSKHTHPLGLWCGVVWWWGGGIILMVTVESDRLYGFSGQSSWLLTQRSWVRFRALPNFLHSGGPGMESTQPHEGKWGTTWKKSSIFGLSRKLRLTTVRIGHADHATPLDLHKLALKFRR